MKGNGFNYGIFAFMCMIIFTTIAVIIMGKVFLIISWFLFLLFCIYWNNRDKFWKELKSKERKSSKNGR